MNLRKFIRWPSPLNVAVHLRGVDELLSNSNPLAPLSADETRRAAEIRSLPRRNAFVAGRKLAREVLSVPLDCAPEAVPILAESNGNPVSIGEGIQFNVSHCGDWCAVAWSAESAVGVDVETIRPVPSMTALVRNFFPSAAQRAFDSAAPQNRAKVFFHWWTQIEASIASIKSCMRLAMQSLALPWPSPLKAGALSRSPGTFLEIQTIDKSTSGLPAQNTGPILLAFQKLTPMSHWGAEPNHH